MNEKKEKLYILCGLSNEDNADIRSALGRAAADMGYEAVCVNRYRKEGILQYVGEHPEFTVLVLQEAMQSNYPYTAEELSKLADDYHLNIIISLNKSHRANPYMKVLYTAGILNALYEEDATAENILNLIFYPRTRRKCRAYYQITTAADAMQMLEILDEERTNGYLSYLEEAQSDDEMIKRYQYIAKCLKIVENIYLVQHLSEKTKQVLSGDETYLQIVGLQTKKKRWPFGKKNASIKNEQTAIVHTPKVLQQADQTEEERDPSISDPHDAGALIEEDISDLLGFQAIAKDVMTKEFYSVNEESEEPGEDNHHKAPVRRKTEARKSKADTKKVVVCIGVLCFLAIVILFGFFVYSEYRSEKAAPVISEQPESMSDESEEEQEETPVLTDTEAESEQEEQKEPQDTPSNEPDTDGNLEEPPGQSEEAAATNTREENSRSSEVQPAEVQQAQEPAAAVASASSSSFTVSVEESQAAPSATPKAAPEENYNGKIFTGSEVASIAKTEESKGNRIYLKTRAAGEGFFTAAEIAGLIDSTCSYLAQGINNGQLSFIQQ